MCSEEKLYETLLLAHYIKTTHNIKRRFKVKTYKEVYKILEHREKEILRLQEQIAEMEDLSILFPFFKSETCLNMFVEDLMLEDLSEPLNKKNWDRYLEVINYLKEIK